MTADAPRHWLLLRGLAREARHWGTLPPRFAARIAPAHVLDLPGVGTEVGRAVPPTIAGIVDDLRARWRAAGHAGPHGLMAISLGGMIAMDWCARYPEDFSRVVLVNSSASNLSWPWERLRPVNLPGVLRAAFARDPAVREQQILEMTTNLARPLDAKVEEWAAYARERPVTPDVARRQLLAALRFRAPTRITVPMCVLASRADRFVDVRCSERIADHFGARLALHDAAGHDLPMDAPEWVLDQVERFLAEA